MDDVVSLSTLGRIARRRWRLLAALAAVGALLGVGSWFVLSPGYSSSSKILFQGAQDDEAMLGEVQIATTLAVLDRAAADLGWGTSGRSLQGSVGASVGQGNVIEISARAASPDRAQQLAERVTEHFITFSGQIVTETEAAEAEELDTRRGLLQQNLEQLAARANELQDAAGLPGTSAEGAAARAELEQIGATQARVTSELEDFDDAARDADAAATVVRGRMIVIEPPLPGGPAAPTILQLTVGGAAVLVVLGVLAILAVGRADRRLRSGEEIGAALGAPVLAEVEVEVVAELVAQSGTSSAPGAGGRAAALLALLSDEQCRADPTTPRDDRTDDVRYRRALARLRGRPGSRLIVGVLVVDDDPIARRAVARLVAVAAAHGVRVAVTTEDDDLGELVRSAAGALDPAGSSVTVASATDVVPPDAMVVIRVIEIDADRPKVAPIGPVGGVLAVLTTGTRTAWQLIGIAAACLDVELSVVGAIVVSPRRALIGEGEPSVGDSAPSTTDSVPVESIG